ncbi:hypothetical protein [Pedococcus bigeumensis]|uniref:Uncharacterized protein n=1 Tax=Pedococcus bigeumensis TaxID=433644 RepID=A0A502CZF8_9MICO|nr:hypothetical protein [Pedococcus bigeumensis]TPG17141.1 hypothetical protein EAH86_10265 [Pedococcus bigeumensis]
MADNYGLRAAAPQGWQVSVTRRPGAEPAAPTGVVIRGAAPHAAEGPQADVTRAVLHACTRPMPADRGDFGSNVVDLLGPDDIFVALVDYGTEVADQGLFENQGMPRLAPSQFGPNRLQRPLPGMSASQHFFSSGGRAFCLFTVVGSHARRMASVPRAAALVASIRITDRATLARQGGRP